MKDNTLDQVYEKYYRELYLYALSLCHNEDLAKDLVSETFYRALITSNLPNESFKFWIFRVLKNQFIDLKRKEDRIREEEKKFVEEEMEKYTAIEEYQLTDFYYDMQAYVSLNIPGNSMSSFTLEEAKGFGNYELSYALENLFSKENSRHFPSISKNRPVYAEDGIYSLKNMFYIWEGFEQIKYSYDEEEKDIISSRERRLNRKNEESLSYLNRLNPLAYVSMTIVFQEDLSMGELYNLSIDCRPLKFKWIGIRTVEPGSQWSENQQNPLIGFNPCYNDEASIGQRPDDIKYPLFYLHPVEIMDDPDLSKLDFPEAMPKAYEIHFKSRLEYLSNRQDFVKVFDYNYYKTDF